MAPHESRDISIRVVFGFAAGLLAILGVMALILAGLYIMFSKSEAKSDVMPSMVTVTALPPEPRLQSNPGEELKNLRATEDALLNSYGWVDQQNGVVRIPIERAMQLLAQTPEATAAATVSATVEVLNEQ